MFVVILAAFALHQADNPTSGGCALDEDEMEASLTGSVLIVSLALLVPAAFAAAIVSKLNLLCKLEDEEERDAGYKPFQRYVYGLASETDVAQLQVQTRAPLNFCSCPCLGARSEFCFAVLRTS